jgi:hypothetical protein
MVEESNRSCSIHGKGRARGDMIMEKTKREKRQKKKGKKNRKKKKTNPRKKQEKNDRWVCHCRNVELTTPVSELRWTQQATKCTSWRVIHLQQCASPSFLSSKLLSERHGWRRSLVPPPLEAAIFAHPLFSLASFTIYNEHINMQRHAPSSMFFMPSRPRGSP